MATIDWRTNFAPRVASGRASRLRENRNRIDRSLGRDVRASSWVPVGTVSASALAPLARSILGRGTLRIARKNSYWCPYGQNRGGPMLPQLRGNYLTIKGFFMVGGTGLEPVTPAV